MKKLIISFIICYCALTVQAQITAGISAGPNFSSMSVHLRDLSTFRIKPIVGLNLNFIADIKLNSNLSLSSGLSFSQKGFNQTLYVEHTPFTAAEMTTRINYLEIPVYIKINTNLTNVNFFYAVGPYFSYGLNGKVKTNIYEPADSSYAKNITWSKSIDIPWNNLPDTYGYTRIKRFDYGISNVVGLKYKNVFLTLDYRWGIRNLMLEYYLDEKMSNSVFSLSVGYIY